MNLNKALIEGVLYYIFRTKPEDINQVRFVSYSVCLQVWTEDINQVRFVSYSVCLQVWTRCWQRPLYSFRNSEHFFREMLTAFSETIPSCFMKINPWPRTRGLGKVTFWAVVLKSLRFAWRWMLTDDLRKGEFRRRHTKRRLNNVW